MSNPLANMAARLARRRVGLASKPAPAAPAPAALEQTAKDAPAPPKEAPLPPTDQLPIREQAPLPIREQVPVREQAPLPPAQQAVPSKPAALAPSTRSESNRVVDLPSPPESQPRAEKPAGNRTGSSIAAESLESIPRAASKPSSKSNSQSNLEMAVDAPEEVMAPPPLTAAQLAATDFSDVFDLARNAAAVAKSQPEKQQSQQAKERTFIVCGSTAAGKSQLLAALVPDELGDMQTTDENNPAADALPRFGLEYRRGFASIARSRRSASERVELHGYECMGGSAAQGLVAPVAINSDTISSSVLVVVVNLAQPREAFASAVAAIDSARAVSHEILSKLEKRKSELPQRLRRRMEQKYAAFRHQDEYAELVARTSPGFPTVIIGTHLDQVAQPRDRSFELLCTALRYLAHANGATLLFDNLATPAVCASTVHVLRQAGRLESSESQPLCKSLSLEAALSNEQLFCVPVGSDAIEDISVPRSITTPVDARQTASQLQAHLDAAYPDEVASGVI